MINNILCIDDDPTALLLCKVVIQKSSFAKDLVTAKNGQDALNYFDSLKDEEKEKEKPDLILLDLNMPVMGGWEFLEHFISPNYCQFNNLKIIILSSSIDPEDYKRSKEYPMVIDFLPKPISKEMIQHIKKTLSL